MRLQNTSKIGQLLTPPGYHCCPSHVICLWIPAVTQSLRISCLTTHHPQGPVHTSIRSLLLCFRLSKDFLKVVKRPLRSFVICHCPLSTHHLFLWFLSPTVSPSLTPFQPSCLLPGLHPLRTPALVFVLPGILFQDSYLALSPLSLFKGRVLRGTSLTTLFKITNLLLRAPWHPNPLPNLIFFHSTYHPLACHII